MLVHSVRHNWPKNAGFSKDRPRGRKEYTFAHFCTPVQVTCGTQTFEVKAGGCILVAPGVTYHLYAPVPLVHNWMHLYPDAGSLVEELGLPLNVPVYPQRNALITEKIRQIEAEFYSDNGFREKMLDIYIQSFLIWLYRALQPDTTSVMVSHTIKKTMKELRMEILSSPEKKWTLAQLAERVPLSPSRFHAVYKALFGTTPTRDMIDIKIYTAKTLLRSQPELSMKELAEKLGYNDQYHFIRQFREVAGITPGKYRNQKP